MTFRVLSVRTLNEVIGREGCLALFARDCMQALLGHVRVSQFCSCLVVGSVVNSNPSEMKSDTMDCRSSLLLFTSGRK